jgi:hypothetical protein
MVVYESAFFAPCRVTLVESRYIVAIYTTISLTIKTKLDKITHYSY